MKSEVTITAPKTGKLLELEGLRGLAALFVVFSHLQFAFFEVDLEAWLRNVDLLPAPLALFLTSLSLAPFNGRFCVWVFWTLSGFALSYRFFVLRSAKSHAQSRAYLFEAALRRYPRLLLPVLAATLFAYALCRLGWIYSVQLDRAISLPGQENGFLTGAYDFPPSLKEALGSSFWTTFFSFHVLPHYDPPLWTMKRELFGSFFIFGFLALGGGSAWRWLAYVVAGIASIGLHQIWLNAFIAGIVLCDLRVNHLEGLRLGLELWVKGLEGIRNSRWLAVVGTVVLVTLVGYYCRRTPVEVGSDPGTDIAYIFLSFLTIAWVQFSWVIRRLLASAPFAFLGRISFGVYISHFPFIFSASAAFYLGVVPWLGHLGTAFLTALLTIPAVIALGTLFYYGADKPSLPLSRWVAEQLLAGGKILSMRVKKHARVF